MLTIFNQRDSEAEGQIYFISKEQQLSVKTGLERPNLPRASPDLCGKDYLLPLSASALISSRSELKINQTIISQRVQVKPLL